MTNLTREAILAAADLSRVPIEVPQWGGTVYVRMLTAAERDLFEESMVTGRGKDARQNLANVRARLAVLCLCDANGVRLFADGDAEALGAKSAAALDRVFAAATGLNALSRRDVEDLAGN